MLKEAGQGFAAVVDVLLKWALVAGVLYVLVIYGWPRLETFWNERENAYKLVPQLQATIAEDARELKAQKDLCKLTVARTSKNKALIDSFDARPVTAGQAPGLNAADIADLLQ